MADLDNNIRGTDVLSGFAAREQLGQVESVLGDVEAMSRVEMLLVGSAGLASAAIVVLGLWKLVELVA